MCDSFKISSIVGDACVQTLGAGRRVHGKIPFDRRVKIMKERENCRSGDVSLNGRKFDIKKKETRHTHRQWLTHETLRRVETVAR